MNIKKKISIGALAASISLVGLSLMNTGCKTTSSTKDKAEKSCSGMKSCSGSKSCSGMKSTTKSETTSESETTSSH